VAGDPDGISIAPALATAAAVILALSCEALPGAKWRVTAIIPAVEMAWMQVVLRALDRHRPKNAPRKKSAKPKI
jgi:hypothetical protein